MTNVCQPIDSRSITLLRQTRYKHLQHMNSGSYIGTITITIPPSKMIDPSESAAAYIIRKSDKMHANQTKIHLMMHNKKSQFQQTNSNLLNN
ncbi:hypothetical protein B5X24_HaOG210020 [Helicoverpa armigera]|nr:hypothetical protein B5X24_HaOG210020 [Helicoverpa armigera]